MTHAKADIQALQQATPERTPDLAKDQQSGLRTDPQADPTRCRTCMGADTYQEQTVSLFFSTKDNPTPFILENVPARVCRQCGERLHPQHAAAVLESIHRGEGRPAATRSVPVFDFNNPGGTGTETETPADTAPEEAQQ